MLTLYYSQILLGNTDSDTVHRTVLTRPFSALSVRLYPLATSTLAVHYSMRLELIGCRADSMWSQKDALAGKVAAASYFR